MSACVKTYKLAPSETPQGKEHKDKREVVKENLRSVRVYDEWQTSAMFDVLWMSDQTRCAYADLYSIRRGFDAAAREQKIQEELAKNNETITFYILADVRDPFHPDLGDDTPAWTIHLDVHGNKVLPQNVDDAENGEELEPEILTLFGHRYRKPKFKKPYIVKFSVGTIKSHIDAKKPFKMIISSVTRQCELGWNGVHHVCVKEIKTVKKRRLPKDEDYYWL